METDLTQDADAIAHLDFDPSDESASKCEGWARWDTGAPDTNTGEHDCSNPAQVHAVWACCGMISVLCVECYNFYINAHAEMRGYGMHSTSRTTRQSAHPLSKQRAFSQVNFL